MEGIGRGAEGSAGGPSTGVVVTVRGPVDPGDLGATYCHEHLLTAPGEHFTGGDEDLVLDDESRALDELRRFRAAGGRGIVDCTTAELGRDAAALRRLAEAADVHVVAVTGHITAHHWGGVLALEDRQIDELTAEFVSDLTEGMDGTDVRAGAVKVGTSHEEMLPAERRVIAAAARAHLATGCPITTHTTAGTFAIEQARALVDEGVEPEAVCIGHLDRRLVWDDHLELAGMGVYLGYDCLGKEKYQPDELRIEFIRRLVDLGFGDRICLGGDMARRSYLEAWGGDRGLRWILEVFVPRLVEAGVSGSVAHSVLTDNVARHLTWR